MLGVMLITRRKHFFFFPCFGPINLTDALSCDCFFIADYTTRGKTSGSNSWKTARAIWGSPNNSNNNTIHFYSVFSLLSKNALQLTG